MQNVNFCFFGNVLFPPYFYDNLVPLVILERIPVAMKPSAPAPPPATYSWICCRKVHPHLSTHSSIHQKKPNERAGGLIVPLGYRMDTTEIERHRDCDHGGSEQSQNGCGGDITWLFRFLMAFSYFFRPLTLGFRTSFLRLANKPWPIHTHI